MSMSSGYRATIAFASQRKRRIFDIEEARQLFLERAADLCKRQGITEYSFRLEPPFAVVVSVTLPYGTTPARFAHLLKQEASAVIRNRVEVLSKMPALWTRKVWWTEGELDPIKEEEMRLFFLLQRSRT